MEELLERPGTNVILAEVKYVIGRSRGDGAALMDVLIDIAGDMAELPSHKALPNRIQEPAGVVNAGAIKTNRGSANAVKDGRPCVSLRETGRCRDGDHCKFQHIKGV